MMREWACIVALMLVVGFVVGRALRVVYQQGVADGIARGAAIASTFGSCQ